MCALPAALAVAVAIAGMVLRLASSGRQSVSAAPCAQVDRGQPVATSDMEILRARLIHTFIATARSAASLPQHRRTPTRGIS